VSVNPSCLGGTHSILPTKALASCVLGPLLLMGSSKRSAEAHSGFAQRAGAKRDRHDPTSPTPKAE
jgi:hypothetical protein